MARRTKKKGRKLRLLTTRRFLSCAINFHNLRVCQCAAGFLKHAYSGCGRIHEVQLNPTVLRARLNPEPTVPSFVPSGGLCALVSLKPIYDGTRINTDESHSAQIALYR
jgi:hypothetical protein